MSAVSEFACPKCGVRIVEQTDQTSIYRLCPSCDRMRAFSAPEVDNTPYGIELASRVADHLERSGEIAYRHPYFCGVGLAFQKGEFLYGYVEEGGVAAFLDTTPVMRRFTDRESFIAWLAQQSDDTMYGWGEEAPGNQRVTRDRLVEELRTNPGAPNSLPE